MRTFMPELPEEMAAAAMMYRYWLDLGLRSTRPSLEFLVACAWKDVDPDGADSTVFDGVDLLALHRVTEAARAWAAPQNLCQMQEDGTIVRLSCPNCAERG